VFEWVAELMPAEKPDGKAIRDDPAAANRVIPGRLIRARRPFGFGVRFDVPADLQNQLGLAISLTNFRVTLSRRARAIKIGQGRVRASFLQVVRCHKRLPSRAVSVFRDGAGNTHTATAKGSARCQ
jgi:hypothetical protein